LSYAVSDKPDEGYRFGGTLVDIGDIFLNEEQKSNPSTVWATPTGE
jgi:hypothetical protein